MVPWPPFWSGSRETHIGKGQEWQLPGPWVPEQTWWLCSVCPYRRQSHPRYDQMCGEYDILAEMIIVTDKILVMLPHHCYHHSHYLFPVWKRNGNVIGKTFVCLFFFWYFCKIMCSTVLLCVRYHEIFGRVSKMDEKYPFFDVFLSKMWIRSKCSVCHGLYLCWWMNCCLIGKQIWCGWRAAVRHPERTSGALPPQPHGGTVRHGGTPQDAFQCHTDQRQGNW